MPFPFRREAGELPPPKKKRHRNTARIFSARMGGIPLNLIFFTIQHRFEVQQTESASVFLRAGGRIARVLASKSGEKPGKNALIAGT